MTKEKQYEISVRLIIPLTVNIKAVDKKTARQLAENLIADFCDYEAWKGVHKEYESGMVDQWGEITFKIYSFSKYGEARK